MESAERAASSRAGSRGRVQMPNIKVVSQPKKSPLLDIIIDLEETVNPLSYSQKSHGEKGKPVQPKAISEEDVDAGDDSDDDSANVRVLPLDGDTERNKSQTAQTRELQNGKHAIQLNVTELGS